MTTDETLRAGTGTRPLPNNFTTINSLVGGASPWAPVSTARTLNPEEPEKGILNTYETQSSLLWLGTLVNNV